MHSIPCDIVLLPSDELARKLVSLSQQFSDRHPLYVLDGDNYYAHLSLYMCQLRTDNLQAVDQVLEALASQTDTFDLTATGYNQAEGYLEVGYERTARLIQLQKSVLETINPLRDGMRAKDRARLNDETGLAKDNLEKYGYRHLGELFRPHATLTKFADDGDVDTSGLPDTLGFSGQFTRLGLFEMGDSGTCVRQIATFSL